MKTTPQAMNSMAVLVVGQRIMESEERLNRVVLSGNLREVILVTMPLAISML